MISGNGDVGIYIGNPISTGNVVAGNYVGTTPNGVGHLGNRGGGIRLDQGATGNIIGGLNETERNVLAANLFHGISLDRSASNNLIEGNYIGVDAAGNPLGNGANGVLMKHSASGNTVGGTTANAANVIAFNQANGIDIGVDTSDQSDGNSILGNSIYGNSGLGIDLGSDGVTPNHTGGATGGAPNGLQNYPVLTTAVYFPGRSGSGGSTTVGGTLNGAARTTYLIQFFATPAADPSGHGQGQTMIGSISVTTLASGNASFSQTISTDDLRGQALSATATDPAGNTSEFAVDLTIADGAGTRTTVASATNPSVYGGPVTFKATVAKIYSGGGTPTGRWSSSTASPISAPESSPRPASPPCRPRHWGSGRTRSRPPIPATLTTRPAPRRSCIRWSIRRRPPAASPRRRRPRSIGQAVTFTVVVSPVAPGQRHPHGDRDVHGRIDHPGDRRPERRVPRRSPHPAWPWARTRSRRVTGATGTSSRKRVQFPDPNGEEGQHDGERLAHRSIPRSSANRSPSR